MEQKQAYLYEEEIEIDLKEVFFVLLNKWHLIFLTGLLCALLGLGCAKFVIPEKYESDTSIYIYNQQTENVTYTDLQTGSTLTKDYEVLVKGRTVLESAIEMLGLDLTYEQISRMVSVNVPSSTRIVEISVQTTDPYLSRDIADAVREISSKSIAEVMGVDAVNVVEKANLPEEKCSPDITKFTALGGVLGVLLASGVLLALFLFNDTIRTQDDVEKYLGLSTLGVIPMDEELLANEKKRKKMKKGIFKKSIGKRAKV